MTRTRDRQNTFTPKKGFTLIELLTVVAIIAILTAILVPNVIDMTRSAHEVSDKSNLRQIVQATHAFIRENGQQYPRAVHDMATDGLGTGGTQAQPDIHDIARAIAIGSGMINDATAWVSQNDNAATSYRGPLFYIDDGSGGGTAGNYESNLDEGEILSYEFVTDISDNDYDTTPLVFTRITSTAESTWGANDIYGVEGGLIAFKNGNVQYFEDLTGQLYNQIGDAVDNIDDAIPADAVIAQNIPVTP